MHEWREDHQEWSSLIEVFNGREKWEISSISQSIGPLIRIHHSCSRTLQKSIIEGKVALLERQDSYFEQEDSPYNKKQGSVVFININLPFSKSLGGK